MGKIKKITCNGCQASWEIKIGAGKMHCYKKYVLPYFGIDEQKIINQELEKEQSTSFEFSLKEGYCNNCNTIISVPCINLGDGKMEYGNCPECNQKIEETSVTSVSCPKCRNTSWKKEFIGFWD